MCQSTQDLLGSRDPLEDPMKHALLAMGALVALLSFTTLPALEAR